MQSERIDKVGDYREERPGTRKKGRIQGRKAGCVGTRKKRELFKIILFRGITK
jgi:hypothetical protein